MILLLSENDKKGVVGERILIGYVMFMRWIVLHVMVQTRKMEREWERRSRGGIGGDRRRYEGKIKARRIRGGKKEREKVEKSSGVGLGLGEEEEKRMEKKLERYEREMREVFRGMMRGVKKMGEEIEEVMKKIEEGRKE